MLHVIIAVPWPTSMVRLGLMFPRGNVNVLCARLKVIYLSCLGSLSLCGREVTDTDFNMTFFQMASQSLFLYIFIAVLVNFLRTVSLNIGKSQTIVS